MTARWAVAASSLAWQDSPADIVVFQSAEQQFDCEQHGYARCSAVNPFSIPAVTGRLEPRGTPDFGHPEDAYGSFWEALTQRVRARRGWTKTWSPPDSYQSG